jgi:hypothetical protein
MIKHFQCGLYSTNEKQENQVMTLDPLNDGCEDWTAFDSVTVLISYLTPHEKGWKWEEMQGHSLSLATIPTISGIYQSYPITAPILHFLTHKICRK